MNMNVREDSSVATRPGLHHFVNLFAGAGQDPQQVCAWMVLTPIAGLKSSESVLDVITWGPNTGCFKM